MNSNLIKCKVLVENMQSSYNEITTLIKELETVDVKIATQTKTSLLEILTSLVEKSKLVKTEKAVS